MGKVDKCNQTISSHASTTSLEVLIAFLVFISCLDNFLRKVPIGNLLLISGCVEEEGGLLHAPALGRPSICKTPELILAQVQQSCMEQQLCSPWEDPCSVELRSLNRI